jgi:hypothetical protein
MEEKPSPKSASRDGAEPPPANDGARLDSDDSLQHQQAEAIRRANGGRDHRAFLAEMAADLEGWFLAHGMIDEAERHRQARVILETPVEPVFDADGAESLDAHDRLMYRYYITIGNATAAQIHLNYLAARGQSID